MARSHSISMPLKISSKNGVSSIKYCLSVNIFQKNVNKILINHKSVKNEKFNRIFTSFWHIPMLAQWVLIKND